MPNHFFSLLKKSFQYPELWKNWRDTLEANKLYKELSQQELDLYYDTLKNYPTLEQKEAHRHPAMTAVLAQKYEPEFVRQLGELKEDSDSLDGQSEDNSIYDLNNNEKGIELGFNYPDINRNTIYDAIMQEVAGTHEKASPAVYTKRVFGKILDDKGNNYYKKLYNDAIEKYNKQLENMFDSPVKDVFNKTTLSLATNDLGQYGQGNIDLYNRPQVKNPDGSISTVRSMSFNDGQNEVLIPTVMDNGTIATPEEAINNYYKTGKYLGKFNTVDDANNYAQRLHQEQQRYYLK